jgi:sec-independent protein translocase protein TatC
MVTTPLVRAQVQQQTVRTTTKPCRRSRFRSSTTTQRANGRGGDGPVVFSFDESGEFVKRTEGEKDEGGEGASSSSSSSSAASDGFKTSLTDDPAFSSAVDADETYAMTPLDKAPAVAKQSFVAAPTADRQREQVRSFLYPGEDELPDDVSMTIWEHLEELRERAIVSAAVVSALILVCFCFAKDLTIFLEEPVKSQGVRFLQLGPGEYFFTTVKVAGYSGLLAGAPVVLYEAIAYILPGLTLNERKTLGPIVLGSSVLFYGGIAFAYAILVPAALKFFVGYADGAVESLWSIDQYFEFVLVLLFSTGLSFQVPVIQLLLGQTGIVTSKQMLSVWRYVVVGSVIAAAVLTPSTDPFTQLLLAAPLMSLYLGGAALVGVFEREREGETAA